MHDLVRSFSHHEQYLLVHHQHEHVCMYQHFFHTDELMNRKYGDVDEVFLIIFEQLK